MDDEQPTGLDGQQQGCIVALIVLGIIIVLIVIWVSTWSCGPGRGKCSFVSMASSVTLNVDPPACFQP